MLYHNCTEQLHRIALLDFDAHNFAKTVRTATRTSRCCAFPIQDASRRYSAFPRPDITSEYCASPRPRITEPIPCLKTHNCCNTTLHKTCTILHSTPLYHYYTLLHWTNTSTNSTIPMICPTIQHSAWTKRNVTLLHFS